MVTIQEINSFEKNLVNDIVTIHLNTFVGFFLTFMGRGFLNQMYRCYCEDENSGLLVAFDNERPIGFLAYSCNMSGLYSFMIKKRCITFAWYAACAFFRNPTVLMRLIRSFLKPIESRRDVAYVELASIGIDPNRKSEGVGSMLIDELKERVDFDKYEYITLETDAVNNEAVNAFYLKNGFELVRNYETHEGRKMNEYHYRR